MSLIYSYISYSFSANFKVTDINCFLMKLAAGAPNLTSITLSGWKGFSCDHLTYLVENMKKLERLDLSSVNVSWFYFLYSI